MTIKEMIQSDKTILSVEDVSEVLGMNLDDVRTLCKAQELPFTFFKSGTRFKFPRLRFLAELGVPEAYLVPFHSEEVQTNVG